MTPSLQRILYVEDDPDIRTIVQLVLETLGGFTLACCSSGQQALAQAQAFAPQLILLDVMMPGMDGRETLIALRQLDGLQQIPVLFMTAKAQPNEVQEYLALGAQGVIAKPFDPMNLCRQLDTLWRSIST